MAKKRLIVANWKMYIESPDEAKNFALTLRRKLRGASGVDVYLAPPTPFISLVDKILESSPIRVGAQAVSEHAGGAHTGEASAKMQKGAGALFTLIGHSERRAAGDSNNVVRTQLERVIAANLIPILCIGEVERGRDGEHFSYIEEQLNSALKGVPKNTLKKLIIAYEPVWAIGKSHEHAMKPAELQEMVIFIKKILAEILDRPMALRVPILYGAAVEAANAPNLIKEGGVNGLLVGHASAQIESFLEIIKATQN